MMLRKMTMSAVLVAGLVPSLGVALGAGALGAAKLGVAQSGAVFADVTHAASTEAAPEVPAPQIATQAANAAVLPPGLVPVSPENWTADMLIGAEVHDRVEASVAKVRDVQVTREGRLQALLVDIGGMWGIGAKTVAVPVAQVTVARPADAPVKGEVRVHLTISTDSLKSLPEVQG